MLFFVLSMNKTLSTCHPAKITSHSDLLCSPFPEEPWDSEAAHTDNAMLLLYAAFAQKRQLGLVLCPLAWPSLELLGGFWGYVQGCETLSNTAFHGIDMLKIKTSRLSTSRKFTILLGLIGNPNVLRWKTWANAAGATTDAYPVLFLTYPVLSKWSLKC